MNHSRTFRYGALLAAVIGLLFVSQSPAAIFSYGIGGSGTGVVAGETYIEASGQSSWMSDQQFDYVYLWDSMYAPGGDAEAGAEVQLWTDLLGYQYSPAQVHGTLGAWGNSYPAEEGYGSFNSFVRLSSGFGEGDHWTVSVLPEVGETLGALATVTIEAAVAGYRTGSGSAVADAWWYIGTDFGALLDGGAGGGAFADSNSLQFQIPLGSSFEMYVSAYAEVYGWSGGSAGMDFSQFEIIFSADVQEGAVPEPATIAIWSLLGALGIAIRVRRAFPKPSGAS